MGNSHNSDDGKHGHLFVTTEKPYFYAGELIKGTAFLHIT